MDKPSQPPYLLEPRTWDIPGMKWSTLPVGYWNWSQSTFQICDIFLDFLCNHFDFDAVFVDVVRVYL